MKSKISKLLSSVGCAMLLAGVVHADSLTLSASPNHLPGDAGRQSYITIQGRTDAPIVGDVVVSLSNTGEGTLASQSVTLHFGSSSSSGTFPSSLATGYTSLTTSAGMTPIVITGSATGFSSGSVTVNRDPVIIDRDGDGVADSVDNCPARANANQADNDRDGYGNVCDQFPNNPKKH